MIEFIRSIPGPLFLLLYIVYSTIVIIAVKLYVSKDDTTQLDVPEPTKVQPVDIGLLKGGVRGAIRVAVYNLLKKKAISIKKEGKKIIVRQKSSVGSLNNLEKAVYRAIGKKTDFINIYKGNYDSAIIECKRRLQDMHLTPSRNTLKRNNIATWLGFILLLSLGVLKLILGILHHKPYGFLIVIIVLACIGLYYIVNPAKLRMSNLGKRFVKDAETRFTWTKKIDKRNVQSSQYDVLYGVALFGITPFLGDGYGDLVDSGTSLFFRIHGDRGCASCGGCTSSSCSGGACGSSCGGGCGGCGGD